jgi:hypothetical protein
MNEIDEYIKKQKSPQKEMCVKLRKIILKHFPNSNEDMKWGVPSYLEGKCYFVSLKDHVNLGFSIKNLSKEQIKLLKGNGKTMRVLEFKSIDEINEKKILFFLKII